MVGLAVAGSDGSSCAPLFVLNMLIFITLRRYCKAQKRRASDGQERMEHSRSRMDFKIKDLFFILECGERELPEALVGRSNAVVSPAGVQVIMLLSRGFGR
jgi:hypothetical protein